MTVKSKAFSLALSASAMLLLLVAGSASAGTVSFMSPANGSAHTVSPSVTWMTDSPVTSQTCTVKRGGTTVDTGDCTGIGFSALEVPQGGGVSLWTVGSVPQFSPDANYEFIVNTNFTSDPDDEKTLALIRDTLAPAVSIGSVTSPTNDNTPTITFSQTELNPNTFECVVSAAGQQSDLVPGYAPCTSPFTPGSPIADGSRAFYVRSTDDAGNIGYAAQGFIVDTVAPIITVTSPQPNQVMQSSVPELSFGAVDPDPGTGVSSFSCRYDSDAFAACNDVNFVSKNLLHGAHTLTIQATDGAANVATSVIPFSVDTDLGADPPTPGRVTFKKKSGKRAGKSYKLSVTASFTVPDGVDPALACKGKVRLSVTGRLPGKKSKTFTKQPSLSASGRTCVTTATFTLPKAYKGKRLTTKLIFRGNTVFGGFQRNGSIKKA